jgi:hypothetical protein
VKLNLFCAKRWNDVARNLQIGLLGEDVRETSNLVKRFDGRG